MGRVTIEKCCAPRFEPREFFDVPEPLDAIEKYIAHPGADLEADKHIFCHGELRSIVAVGDKRAIGDAPRER